MRRIALIAFLAAMLLPSLAYAVRPDEMLKNPELEARARHLSEQLRCMVCQNQSIDDSDAPLAHDLRVLVRDRLTQGDSDQQVLHYLVARYGDFILLKPPFEWSTLLLWGLPPAALIAGMVGLFLVARGRNPASGGPAALNENEQHRLATLVEPKAE